MKRTVSVLLLSLVISNTAYAGIADSIRPYVEKYLGEDIAVKIFGEVEETILLPAIPTVSKDAKNIRPELKTSKTKISKEKLEKANLSFIYQIYKATRMTDPNENEVARWMNVMSQGGSREGVYRALVLDGTYAGRENTDAPITDETIEFVQYYLSTFLDKSISKESLEKSNFYTLKRIITEQTLEILDELTYKKMEDFYNWYAVFSAEVAKKYPSTFDNKVRVSTSREKHKKWAMYVPVQHVKSEVMIKLHTLFNVNNQK
ncbi:hypothetical protein [Halobacteriovorax sp. HLS]|uniref:hypothetical protein n=1 Tax=Halobacteriovorax sp. HLS TaxID=2234000 RepID=UPI000FDC592F|nr:hypothetical protein [Halobacteriovorax sp. HLS]